MESNTMEDIAVEQRSEAVPEPLPVVAPRNPKLSNCIICNRLFASNQAHYSTENCSSIFKACAKYLKSLKSLRASKRGTLDHGSFCSDCLNHGEKLSVLYTRLKETRKELNAYADYFLTDLGTYRVERKSSHTGHFKKGEDDNNSEEEEVLVKTEMDWYDDDCANNNSEYNDDSEGAFENPYPLQTSGAETDGEEDIKVAEQSVTKNSQLKQRLKMKAINKLPWKCEVCSKVCMTSRQRKDHKRTVHYKRYQKLLLDADEDDEEEDALSSYKQEVDNNSCRQRRTAAVKALSKFADYADSPQRNIKNENDSGDDHWIEDEEASLSPLDGESIVKNEESPEKFKCSICARNFTKLADLKSHIPTHTSWECDKCQKMFYTKRSKQNHKKYAHSKSKEGEGDTLVCEIDNCNANFTSEYDFEVHCMTHTDEIPFECQVCHSKFSNIRNYLNHQRDSACTTSGIPGSPKEISCDACQATFKAKYLLLTHRKQHHSKLRNYKCELCVKNFRRKPDFMKHVMAHTDERPYSCDICGKQFRSSSGVGPHRLSHTGRETFACKQCEVKCLSKHALKRHIQSEHQDKVYECPVCRKQYKIYGDFKGHVKSHSRTIPCEECGKTFYRLADLNRHRRRHTGNLFQCPSCPKGFLNLSSLKKHTEESHMGKSFVCDICGKVLATTLSHAVHVKSHELKEKGEKPFPCTDCEKKFYTKRELTEHVRIHTGERLSCTVCGDQFTRQILLNYHMRCHTGNYKYKCDVCGKTMVNQSTLTIHMRMHTGEKPFQCHLCGKDFSRKDHMKEHVRRHERDQNT